MKSDWIVVFVAFAGATVIVGTYLFLRIYQDTARHAKIVRGTIHAVKTITEEQIRETHRRGFDVEAYIKDRNFFLEGANVTVEPFMHDRKAVWGFCLYMASAIFGAVAAIMSAVH